jgi:hypothetical protein
LTESEIKRLATFVGGQVKDLDTVITGLLRGYTPSRTFALPLPVLADQLVGTRH